VKESDVIGRDGDHHRGGRSGRAFLDHAVLVAVTVTVVMAVAAIIWLVSVY
jgi:hypothetical protein